MTSNGGDADDVLETMEIDLDIAECGEILERHGVSPTPALVMELWDWKEQGPNHGV